jgi:D-3-phosphoglycerate dehydrogenase
MKLLITAEIDDESIQQLREFYTVEYESWRRTGKVYFDSTEFSKKIQDFGAEALLVEPDIVDEYVLDNCNIRIIGSCRGNPNNVSIDYATSKGIPVIHPPARNADSVADLTICFAISLLRKAAFAYRDLLEGKVQVFDDTSMITNYNKYTGSEVSSLTYGIIGFGAIGYKVAQRLHGGFGVNNILYFDPFVPESDRRVLDVGARAVELDTLVKESDVITVHAKASEENFRLISKEKLSMMKPSACFINTARSSLIDEDALYQLLIEKKISGAALDVSEAEPIDSSNRFLKLENALLTPHIGGSTRDVIHRQSVSMTDDLIRFAKGQRPANVINAEVFERRA